MNNKILKLYFDLREKYGSPEGSGSCGANGLKL